MDTPGSMVRAGRPYFFVMRGRTTLSRLGDTPRVRLDLTRRGDYAVRAMLALAADTTSDWLSVPRISASMAIPTRFLPAVMTDLVRAGLVEGRTGRTGGYRLRRPAASISLLEVIDAVEPDPEPRPCVLRGGPCGRDGFCAVHDAFTAARTSMSQVLGDVSLADVSARLPA
jgi:Rrf2 family iron-sulfur cluster assembly transcriptional regulator